MVINVKYLNGNLHTPKFSGEGEGGGEGGGGKKVYLNLLPFMFWRRSVKFILQKTKFTDIICSCVYSLSSNNFLMPVVTNEGHNEGSYCTFSWLVKGVNLTEVICGVLNM